MAPFPSLWWIIAAYAIISSSAASKTCDTLAAGSNVQIEEQPQISYLQDQHEYWSSACGALLPACILVPTTSDEVSLVVNTLLENNETFAIKSGGHNPNQNYSSVDGGPLINLKGLNEINYDANTGTVRVGPGNRWSDVAKALEPYNVTAVGGRIGHVGVGGYLLGGGLSYLSTQYGWATDNIVEAEVVLANGSIVTASQTENVDLFNVLRGGGNSYGIVTAFTLKTYPIGTVWGGQLTFGSDKTDEILSAVRDFTENYPDDKAAIIATNEITLATLVNVWILFVFYDGEEPPAGTFDRFTNIGPLTNTAGPTTYYELLSEFDALVIYGQALEITTEMSPLPNETVGLQVMKSYYDQFLNSTNSIATVPGLLATTALQPLPKRLARKARENGGDLLDLDDSIDRILFEVDFAYALPEQTSLVDKAVVDFFSGTRDLVLDFITNGTLPDGYIPLFMNDANWQQDYFSRLRPEKLQYAKEVRDRYDPDGFFKVRTGGFKL